jgi:hypothetical protein
LKPGKRLSIDPGSIDRQLRVCSEMSSSTRYSELNYRIEVERASPLRKEGVQSTGDLKQLAVDLVALLKRLYGSEAAKRILAEQVLPVLERERIVSIQFDALPGDDEDKDSTETETTPPVRIL